MTGDQTKRPRWFVNSIRSGLSGAKVSTLSARYPPPKIGTPYAIGTIISKPQTTADVSAISAAWRKRRNHASATRARPPRRR